MIFVVGLKQVFLKQTRALIEFCWPSFGYKNIWSNQVSMKYILGFTSVCYRTLQAQDMVFTKFPGCDQRIPWPNLYIYMYIYFIYANKIRQRIISNLGGNHRHQYGKSPPWSFGKFRCQSQGDQAAKLNQQDLDFGGAHGMGCQAPKGWFRRNPAIKPVHMVNIPMICWCFFTSQVVVWDFFHQQSLTFIWNLFLDFSGIHP